MYFIWARRHHQINTHHMKRLEVNSLRKKDILQTIRDSFGIHHDDIIFINNKDVFRKCEEIIFKRVPPFYYNHGDFSEDSGKIQTKRMC